MTSLFLSLLVKLGNWASGIQHLRDLRAMGRAFPQGTRVLMGGCRCSDRWRGGFGTVEKISSGESDYIVWIDGDNWPPDSDLYFSNKPRWQLICGKGMTHTGSTATQLQQPWLHRGV